MNISFIIPNFNGKHLLEKNLPTVLAAVGSYKDGEIEIIVSDDHSTDGSVEYLHEFTKKYSSNKQEIIILENTHGQGFSKNVNFAAKHATGDILLLLNTDVSVEKNFLSPLLRHFDDAKMFAVGCAERTEDKGTLVTYGRSKGIFVRGFVQHSAREGEGESTFWVSCGSGAFRKSIWDKLEGLDEIYNPFYWEDIDISYRAVKSGYKVLFEAQSVVHHDHNEGAIKSTVAQTKVTETAYRNQYIFMWKNITDTFLLFQHVMWLPYHLLTAFIRGDKEFSAGFFKAIFLLPKIIQLRDAKKKLFVLSDREVLVQ